MRPGSMAALVAGACLAAGALALPAVATTTTTGSPTASTHAARAARARTAGTRAAETTAAASPAPAGARFVPPLTGAPGPGSVLPRLPAGAGHRVLSVAALPGPPGSVQASVTAIGTRQGEASGRAGPGTVTGVVRARSGQLLAGACVTAAGASGAGAARTSADGRFTITGLRAGRYTMEFRDCAAPGRYWPQWSGGAMAPALASPLRVRAAAVTRVAPVILRPAGRAALFARPSGEQVARTAAARLRRGGSSSAASQGASPAHTASA